MNSRELHNQIRQLKLRTIRLAGELAAGARALARFTVRPAAASKTNWTISSALVLECGCTSPLLNKATCPHPGPLARARGNRPPGV